jgi:RNA exonuclease 4
MPAAKRSKYNGQNGQYDSSGGSPNAHSSSSPSLDISKPSRSTPEAVSSNWQRLRGEIAAVAIPPAADAPPPAPTPWWVKKDAAKRKLREEKAALEAEAAGEAVISAPSRPFDATKRVDDILDVKNAVGEVTDVVALDCEMVGVGVDGAESVLAQVCIVNEHGAVIYNQRVQTVERVIDYRTEYSGIRPRDLKAHTGALPFAQVQKEVAEIVENKVLVGHALSNDLRALMLTHPRHLLRDTARYRPLQRAPKKPHALRYLTKTILGVTIQEGEHDPAEDARAALLLYKHLKKDWERWMKEKMSKMRGQRKKAVTAKS